MAFLTSADYLPSIKNEVKDIVSDENLSIIAAAELAAQEELSGYLRNRNYDVTAAFATTGDDRNKSLVMFLCDMVIYHIHARQPRGVPEIRQVRYEQAVEWCEKVSRGVIALDLPKVEDSDGNPKTGTRFGHSTDPSPNY